MTRNVIISAIPILLSFFLFSCGADDQCSPYEEALNGTFQLSQSTEFALKFDGGLSGILNEVEKGHPGGDCEYVVESCETGATTVKCDNFNFALIIFVRSMNVLEIDGVAYSRI